MQFGDAYKIALCNAVARHLGAYGLPNQRDFARYLRALPEAKKTIAGAQILTAYRTGRQYGLKQAFSKLYPGSCSLVDTVCWGARYEIYHSMVDAFRNAEKPQNFVKLLKRNLASGEFRYNGEDDERVRLYSLGPED